MELLLVILLVPTIIPFHLFNLYIILCEAWGSAAVKALRYWSDGPGIDSRWCH
jgi:hypothetical protein